jgi:hypothetical protein
MEKQDKEEGLKAMTVCRALFRASEALMGKKY